MWTVGFQKKSRGDSHFWRLSLVRNHGCWFSSVYWGTTEGVSSSWSSDHSIAALKFSFQNLRLQRECCESIPIQMVHFSNEGTTIASMFSFGSLCSRYLVDPASSHMLVSKIKPCMSKHKPNMVKPRMAHYNSHSLLDLRVLLGYLW